MLYEVITYSDAYTTIVAGGDHANTLHYIKNDSPLNDGDLVLIDAGCEYRHYATDITRTFPVGGRFTAAQREVYEAVLEVQLAVIAQIGPGVLKSRITSYNVCYTKLLRSPSANSAGSGGPSTSTCSNRCTGILCCAG